MNQANTAALLTRLQSSFFITCDHGVAGNKELSFASQRGILLRMFCKLVLMRETTGIRLRRFPAQEKQEDTSENNNGYCIWDNLSYHFSLCNLNGSGKVLKLLCGVWKEVTLKNERLYKRLQVLSCDCLGVRCRWYYLWRMQEACRRAQTNWIVYFYWVIAISSYRWSFEVLTFLWAFFRAPTVLLVQCTSNYSEKLKFTKVHVFSKVSFWHESQPAGPITKTRKVSVE